MLTADIELLEVFYAHTISPICIAVIVSAIMAAFWRVTTGCWGCMPWGPTWVIGLLVPVAAAKSARRSGENSRVLRRAERFVLDSLRGVRERSAAATAPSSGSDQRPH